MINLRPYQEDSLTALNGYFERHNGNPLIVLPTGTGKSVVIAEFIRRTVADWPETRFLMLTHVRELIAQNFAEMIGLWPNAPAGIYSAGLGKRDLTAQIVFAGIQSIHKRALEIGQVDLVLVDEAHLIPRSEGTMYRRFLEMLLRINPYLKIIGFTATPYRLDSGLLHEGDGALFSDIAYDYSILRAITEGYLCPVIPKEDVTQLDTSGVGTRGGEFVAGQLEAAVDTDEANRAVVSEIILYGQDRGSWIVFCAGVSHALHVRDAIRQQGYSCETVSGETPTAERDRILRDFKLGRTRCLTNANVLTTGFNAPGVDLIAMARPTKSVGLYVQMIGRGTRLAEGKDDCLVLDFAGNIARHGPLDQIDGSRRARKSGKSEEPPKKECPNCSEPLALNARACPVCDHQFGDGEDGGPGLALSASSDPLLSTQIKPQWVAVSGIAFGIHEKPDKPPSLKVTYRCGMQLKTEWVCLEHAGYAREKACHWWRQMAGTAVPSTVFEALSRQDEIRQPTRILMRRTGKYEEVVKRDFTPIEQESAA